MKTRKLAMVVCDRANWGRLEPLASAIRDDGAFDLNIICGGTTVLSRFKSPANDIENSGFTVSNRVFHELEGSTSATMAQSIGLGVIQYTAALEQLAPDFVLIIGDRYEALSAAIAAAYTNRCIIHLQGGEVSGSLDESARHAITKLAHYHAPATDKAKRNLIRMGERADTILGVGCPSSDMASTITPRPNGKLLVVYHPDTAKPDSVLDVAEILTAINDFANPTILFWPNIDSGSDSISKTIRVWRDHHQSNHIEYVTNVEPAEYQQMIADAACCVGNSSSFIRDASFYGTPVVLVGDRQDGRERSLNVMKCSPIAIQIAQSIRFQRNKRYKPSQLYGDGKVSQRIVAALKRIEPYSQKRLAYDIDGVGSRSCSGWLEGHPQEESCAIAR